MSVRSTRRYPTTPELPLNNIERLLLAQAVWELGTSWGSVAKLLSKHPLLARPKSFFTAQFCHSAYDTMIDEAGLERSEANNAIHSTVNLKLAQTNYQLRFAELRELIQNEETKFKSLLSEIEDIRAGLWGVKSQTEQAESYAGERLPQDSKDATQGLPLDEVFGGSDLSGVTDSSSSLSQPQDEIELSPSVDLEVAPTFDVEEGTPRLMKPPEEVSSRTEVPEPFKNELPAENQQHSPIALHDDQDVIVNEATQHVDSEAVDSPLHLQDPQNPEHTSRTERMPSDVKVGETTPRPSPQREDVPENATHTGMGMGMGEVPQNLIHQEEEEEDEAKEAVTNLEEEETDQESETEKKQELESVEQTAIEKARETNPPVREVHLTSEIATKVAEDPYQTEREPLEDLVDPDGESVESPEMLESNVAVDESNSSGDEPTLVTRRSTRRKSSAASSAPPLQTRGRLRRQAQTTETEVSPMDMDIDDDGDEDEKDRSPLAEDDQRSSPIPDSAIPRRRSGKRKASFVEGIESHRDRKRARDESEPAEEDDPSSHSLSSRPRPTRHGARTEEQVALKRFQNVISMLHSQISQHRNGNIFHNPIKNSEAPDYHEIVKRPMDLKTIKAKVKDGLIANSLEYQRDIYLMFANAMMYNRPGSDVHTMAEDMMLESDRQIYNFRQTEGLVRGAKR